MKNFKKILVIGGGGYVGSYLVPLLLENNYFVTVFDLFIYGKDKIQEHKNLKIIQGDMRDADLLKNVIPGHDCVIHLACISNDPSFDLDPELGKSINHDSFLPLVKISKASKCSNFIYASSSSVYGLKSEPNVNESMSLEPLTDYSKFKVLCEKIILDNQNDHFTTTVIRPATVCGYAPRQRMDLTVNILTNHAVNNKRILVFGGDQKRPNINIKDMARVYVKVLESEKSKIAGEIFNAGYENYTIKKLAEIVRKKIDEKINIDFQSTHDQRSYHISSEKIKEKLGFQNHYDIEEAVESLKIAFTNKQLKDSLNNPLYFNIKRMKEINLK